MIRIHRPRTPLVPQCGKTLSSCPIFHLILAPSGRYLHKLPAGQLFNGFLVTFPNTNARFPYLLRPGVEKTATCTFSTNDNAHSLLNYTTHEVGRPGHDKNTPTPDPACTPMRENALLFSEFSSHFGTLRPIFAQFASWAAFQWILVAFPNTKCMFFIHFKAQFG